MGIDSFILGGHSLGAIIATAYAAKVRSLTYHRFNTAMFLCCHTVYVFLSLV